MKQKTINIYHWSLCRIGGVETFLYNWCLGLRNYYDITVLYHDGDLTQYKRLSKIVKMIKYDPNERYESDIFIRNSVWGIVPNNCYSTDNRYLEMPHANYKFLLDKGKLFQQYQKFDRTNEIISCGDGVRKMRKLALNQDSKVILNILAPKKEVKPILHLISCTRLDSEKGWNRMLKLADKLRSAGIKFDWKIFTDSTNYKCDYEEFHFYKQRFDIFDYVADSTYTVLLSDSEGLPYTVQESLQYQTPCIVTDVNGNNELIKDGINGYIVPLDMNFDVNKLLDIPKCKEYDNKALENWIKLLGNPIYVEKEEMKEMLYEVEATKKFDGLIDAEVSTPENQVIRQTGDRWIVGEERMNYLLEHEAIIVIGKIVEIEKQMEVSDKIPERLEKAIKKNARKKTVLQK